MIGKRDYDLFIRTPATLASRLLDSPQAIHYFHSMYFGQDTKVPGTKHRRYWSDKNINSLSSEEIEATQEELILLPDRLNFEFCDIGDAYGETFCCPPIPGEDSCKSVIRLSKTLYLALQSKGDKVYNALNKFIMANTMLHEVAHAAWNDFAGVCLEDYFEESFVAEAGFELESRTFGLCWDSEKPLAWYAWQTSWLCGSDYHMPDLCHEPKRLVKESLYWDSDYNFLLKLFDDSFWDEKSGEYARRGGVALLPPPVIDICRQGVSSKGPTSAYSALPMSVKQLWMASKGLKFSQQRDSELADEESEIQEPTSETESSYWYLAAVDDSSEKVLCHKRHNTLDHLQDDLD